MMFLLCSSSWFRFFLSLLKPPSPRLHRNWFHNGCQTGFARSPASYQFPQKPHISRKLPFFRSGGARRGGGDASNVWPPHVSRVVFLFRTTSSGRFLSLLMSIFRQNEASGNTKRCDGDTRFLDTSSFIVAAAGRKPRNSQIQPRK